jgi:hypothetical protein
LDSFTTIYPRDTCCLFSVRGLRFIEVFNSIDLQDFRALLLLRRRADAYPDWQVIVEALYKHWFLFESLPFKACQLVLQISVIAFRLCLFFCRFFISSGHDDFTSSCASIQLNVSDLYNNRGFSIKPNDSSLEGYGSGYPAQSLPPSKFLYNGINFAFPEYKTSGNDNVLALGQTIEVPRG